jgi:hypothetical protein
MGGVAVIRPVDPAAEAVVVFGVVVTGALDAGVEVDHAVGQGACDHEGLDDGAGHVGSRDGAVDERDIDGIVDGVEVLLQLLAGVGRCADHREDLAGVDVEHDSRGVEFGADGRGQASAGGVPVLHLREADVRREHGLHAGLQHDVEREAGIGAGNGRDDFLLAGVAVRDDVASQAPERAFERRLDA